MDFGLADYRLIWEFQKDLVQKKIQNYYPDIILTGQHYPVFTIGKSGKVNNFRISRQHINSLGIPVYHVERGGDVTWHGPGQLICYPILDIEKLGCDLHRLVFFLEEITIKTLKYFDIQAFRIKGMRGVWTEEGKIASVGLSLKNGISFHGIALNVNPDLSFFEFIHPCGIKDIKICSIASIRRDDISILDVKAIFLENLLDLFYLRTSKIFTTDTPSSTDTGDLIPRVH